MEILDAINNRRSIREFKDKKVPKKIIQKLIEAATKAPSDENSQPWAFTVIEDSESKEKIGMLSIKAGKKYFKDKKKELMEKFKDMGEEKCIEMVKKFRSGQLFSFLSTVPILIIIFSENNFFSHISTGAATENLMLAAQAYGLGSCWTVISLTDKTINKQIKKIAKIAKNKSIISVLALGYPAKIPKARPRTDINNKIRWL